MFIIQQLIPFFVVAVRPYNCIWMKIRLLTPSDIDKLVTCRQPSQYGYGHGSQSNTSSRLQLLWAKCCLFWSSPLNPVATSLNTSHWSPLFLNWQPTSVSNPIGYMRPSSIWLVTFGLPPMPPIVTGRLILQSCKSCVGYIHISFSDQANLHCLFYMYIVIVVSMNCCDEH